VVPISGNVTVLASSESALGYLSYRLVSEKAVFSNIRIPQSNAEGAPQDSWTVPSWNLEATTESWAAEAIADIESIVEGIRQRVLPYRSPMLMALARRAAQAAKEQPEDIMEWASKLSQDIVDADD
jgi:hypothetical protein